MVRIGTVGVGGMGQAHCGSLRNVKNCQFVAVADVRPDQVKSVGEKLELSLLLTIMRCLTK